MYCHIVMLAVHHYVLFLHPTALTYWPDVLRLLRTSLFCNMHTPTMRLHCFPCSESDFDFYAHCWKRAIGKERVYVFGNNNDDDDTSWDAYQKRFISHFPTQQLCWNCMHPYHGDGKCERPNVPRPFKEWRNEDLYYC